MVRGDPLLGVSDRTPESSFPLTCLYLEVGRILERPEITESTPPTPLLPGRLVGVPCRSGAGGNGGGPLVPAVTFLGVKSDADRSRILSVGAPK